MSSTLTAEVNGDRVAKRKAYLKRRREQCIEEGTCVICQTAKAMLGHRRCWGCTKRDAEAKGRQAPPRPAPIEEPAAEPTFFFGDGLPEDDPHHRIEWNPRSWDWRTGHAPSVTAVAG